DGVAVINDHRIDPVPVMIGAADYPENIIENLSARYKTVAANATAFAARMGAPKAFNIVVLGMVARHLEFSYDDWLSVIEAVVPPKTVEVNKKAFEAGYNGTYI
ncbi:MAG: 2-oxoacid:acceptor oxidoreductase family protein, partial [Acidobacteriota bacterium]|nr:2-oxoacid:acceptor oxidoreductase family protein [Acidobacteriota bacterium]